MNLLNILIVIVVFCIVAYGLLWVCNSFALPQPVKWICGAILLIVLIAWLTGGLGLGIQMFPAR